MQLQKLEDVFSLSGECSPTHVGQPVRVVYLHSVVQTAQEAGDLSTVLRELAKFHRAAIMHGFRGRSSGGKNGVVEINNSDTALMRDYARLLGGNTGELVNRGVNLSDIVAVKVVGHVKNGNRMIGALDKAIRPYALYLLGVSNYGGGVA